MKKFIGRAWSAYGSLLSGKSLGSLGSGDVAPGEIGYLRGRKSRGGEILLVRKGFGEVVCEFVRRIKCIKTLCEFAIDGIERLGESFPRG